MQIYRVSKKKRMFKSWIQQIKIGKPETQDNEELAIIKFENAIERKLKKENEIYRNFIKSIITLFDEFDGL